MSGMKMWDTNGNLTDANPRDFCRQCIECDVIRVMCHYIRDRTRYFTEKELRAFDLSETLVPRGHANDRIVPLTDVIQTVEAIRTYAHIKETSWMRTDDVPGAEYDKEAARFCENVMHGTLVQVATTSRTTFNNRIGTDLMEELYGGAAICYSYDREANDDTAENYYLRKSSITYRLETPFTAEMYKWRAEYRGLVRAQLVVDIMQKFPTLKEKDAHLMMAIPPTCAAEIARSLIRERLSNDAHQRYSDGKMSPRSYLELKNKLQINPRCTFEGGSVFSPCTTGLTLKTEFEGLIYMFDKFAKTLACEMFTIETLANGPVKQILDVVDAKEAAKPLSNESAESFLRTVNAISSCIPKEVGDYQALPYFLDRTVNFKLRYKKRHTTENGECCEECAPSVLATDIVKSYRTCKHNHRMRQKFPVIINALRKICLYIDYIHVRAVVHATLSHQFIAKYAPWSVGNGAVARFFMSLFPLICTLPPVQLCARNEDAYSHVSSVAIQQNESTPFAHLLCTEINLGSTFGEDAMQRHSPEACKFLAKQHPTCKDLYLSFQTTHFMWHFVTQEDRPGESPSQAGAESAWGINISRTVNKAIADMEK